MKEELITVIVPIYKVEKYLNRCIDSIINQTYNNLEIILVDDGSPDNCGKICDKYAKKDKRVKVIHKKNGGLSDARNTGIDIAKGKYIAFVDSDDFIAPNMYEVLYKNIKKEDADISIANYYKFENEEEISDDTQEEKITIYTRDEMYENMYNDYLGTVVAWNKLYKKSLFNEIRYPVGKIIEDSAIIHYLIYTSEKIVITNLQLYFYFQRQTSIMNTPQINLLDELDFLYERVNFFEKIGLQEKSCYNITIEKYINRLIQLYYLFHKTKQYKKSICEKYFKYMEVLLKKYKFSSNKRLIKYNLFCYASYIFYLAKRIKNIWTKICNKIYIKKSNNLLKKEYIKYNKQVLKEGKQQYIIFNAPNHGNLGDHAILLAEQKIMKDKGLESFYVLSHDTNYFIDKFKERIRPEDKIMITGGGNFGTIWEHEQIRANKVIENFKNNTIIVFPQTVYYSKDRHGNYALKRDKKIYKSCEKITFCCRDKRSYDFCINNFEIPDIKYTPDVVTYLYNITEEQERHGIQMCFRNDVEKTTSENEIEKILLKIRQIYPKEEIKFFTTVNKGKYTFNKAKREIKELLNQIAGSKMVMTDRLHPMIFAAITNTPCIAFPNSSGKVQGVFEWLNKKNNYIFFLNSIKELDSKLEKLDIEKTYKYENEYMKEELRNIISREE